MKYRSRHILIVILCLLLILSLADYFVYKRVKNNAIQQINNTNLNTQDVKILKNIDSSKCNGTKVLAGVSYNCIASKSIEYKIDTTNTQELLRLFETYEKMGWETKGTTKDSFLNSPESLSFPACAGLYNDNIYPNEEVRVKVCRRKNTSSIRVEVYSKYRPSVVMMLYLGIKAQSQIQ